MNEPDAEADWYPRMQQERHDTASKAIATLKSLCEPCAVLGITEIRVTYDG